MDTPAEVLRILPVPLMLLYAETHFRFFRFFPSLIYRREPDVIVYDVDLVRPRVPPSPYVGERAEPLLPGPAVPLVPFLPLR